MDRCHHHANSLGWSYVCVDFLSNYFGSVNMYNFFHVPLCGFLPRYDCGQKVFLRKRYTHTHTHTHTPYAPHMASQCRCGFPKSVLDEISVMQCEAW